MRVTDPTHGILSAQFVAQLGDAVSSPERAAWGEQHETMADHLEERESAVVGAGPGKVE
jgi:hypothetical protein